MIWRVSQSLSLTFLVWTSPAFRLLEKLPSHSLPGGRFILTGNFDLKCLKSWITLVTREEKCCITVLLCFVASGNTCRCCHLVSLCVSPWQPMVLETPTVRGTATEDVWHSFSVFGEMWTLRENLEVSEFEDGFGLSGGEVMNYGCQAGKGVKGGSRPLALGLIITI